MATKNRRPGKTPEERQAEIETLTEQLNTAVADLTSSESWLAMLQVSARFTHYSPSNVLLLWMQATERGVSLSRVAGYRTWQGLGRQVVKGTKSLAVMAPVRRRLTVTEATEMAARGVAGCWQNDGRPAIVVRGFKLERVFRYEDTEGEPLPEAPPMGNASGESPEGTWEALAALVAAAGFSLAAEPEAGGARGHTDYSDRIVNIDPNYPAAEQIHILVHELGHIRCDHETRREIPRSQRETEAESVAFIVCSLLGLDLGDTASVYVGGWSDGNTETITAAQSAIHKAARSLLADLSADDGNDGNGDETERSAA